MFYGTHFLRALGFNSVISGRRCLRRREFPPSLKLYKSVAHLSSLIGWILLKQDLAAFESQRWIQFAMINAATAYKRGAREYRIKNGKKQITTSDVGMNFYCIRCDEMGSGLLLFPDLNSRVLNECWFYLIKIFLRERELKIQKAVVFNEAGKLMGCLKNGAQTWIRDLIVFCVLWCLDIF